MRLRAALLALLALLAGSGCTRRERLNPLDAANPRTGGAPEGFNAIADDQVVHLVWTARRDLPVDGFQVVRLAPGDSLYRPLGPLLPNSSAQLTDPGVANGGDYRYRLYYVIGGAPAARFAEDVATPGALRPWVTDAGGGRVIRLSPDGRDVLRARSGLGTVVNLAVTPGSRAVWAADPFSGLVYVIDPFTFDITHVFDFIPKPSTMALDPVDGSAWICDLTGSVRHFFPNGNPASPAALSPLTDPEGVATNPTDGSLWVTEYAGLRVRRFDRGGAPLGTRALLNPSRVAVDSATGEAWVASLASGWLWEISPALSVVDSLRFQGPIGVATDSRRRIVWIADTAGGELVAVDMQTAAVKFRFAGLDSPRDVTVDLATGDAWVVSPTEGRAWRISAAGAMVASVGGLGEPAEVRLDPVP